MMGWQPRVRVDRRGRIQLRLASGESELIASLVGQLQQLLAADDDENLRRLYPNAYPDRDELEQEYQALVHDELLSSRFDALDIIERTLDNDTLSDDELAGWMRGVNDLRLVLGTRLDVSEEPHPVDPDDPGAGAYVLYDWLGLVLTDIVDARTTLL